LNWIDVYNLSKGRFRKALKRNQIVNGYYPLSQQNEPHTATIEQSTYPLAGQSYEELTKKYVKRNDRQLIVKFAKEQGKITAEAALKKGECVGPAGRFVKGFLSHP
jgi:hypothetical protein